MFWIWDEKNIDNLLML